MDETSKLLCSGCLPHKNNTKSEQAYFLQVYSRTKRIYQICESICYVIFNLDLHVYRTVVNKL